MVLVATIFWVQSDVDQAGIVNRVFMQPIRIPQPLVADGGDDGGGTSGTNYTGLIIGGIAIIGLLAYIASRKKK